VPNKVDSFGSILTLISIPIIVGPIVAGVMIYRNNISDLVWPENIAFNQEIPGPQFVDAYVDLFSATVFLVLNVTNPFKITLVLDNVSCDVYCDEHHFLLGHTSIANSSEEIGPDSSALVSLVLKYTPQAEIHMITQHLGEASMYVDLENIALNIQGIEVTYRSLVTRVGPVALKRRS
jgi:hypothetical protein